MFAIIELPFDKLRFDIVFWLLISGYGIAWLWQFKASIPDGNEDDHKLFKYNKSDLYFRLLTSMIFYCIWLFQFQYAFLYYLTILEIVVVIILYICTYKNKKNYKKLQDEKLQTIRKVRAGNFK